MRTHFTHALTQVFVFTLALGATACSTPEGRAERARADMAQRMTMHGPECAQLGFARDSDPWRQCILEQSAQAELDSLSAYHAGWRHGMW